MAQTKTIQAGEVKCAKCGKTFKSASEYRLNARSEPICRRPCREIVAPNAANLRIQ